MNISRAKLENKVFEMIQRDSKNTPHFNYRTENFEKGTTTLEVFTYNPLQSAIHFLHSVTGDNPLECLTKMIHYLEYLPTVKKDRNSYTVTWKRVGSEIENKSYYFEESIEDALNKFIVGKNATDYEIDVKQNPMS